MRITIVILLLFAFNTAEVLGQADEAMKLKKDKDNIKVYLGQVQESDMIHMKIITTVNAPVSNIAALLQDINSYPEWMTNVETTTVLKELSEHESYYYIAMSAPWPVSNRDNIVHIQMSENPASKVVTFNVNGVPDFIPEKEGFVRVKKSYGTWRITPLENGETEVASIYSSDPSGSMPLWVVRLFIVEGSYEMFVNMKELVKKEKYQH